MRNSIAAMIALAMVASAPAAAQDNATANAPATTDTGAVPEGEALTNVGVDPAMNGLTAGPGAAPVTTDTAAVDTSYGAQTEDDDRDFPWGVLGLLGLLGLIPRMRNRDSNRDR